MRFKHYIIIAAALVAAGLGTWAVTATASNTIGGATPIQTTITLANDSYMTFAPPPPGATPALTVQEADDAHYGHHVEIPDDVTVQIGLLTVPVGPDCGPECEKNNIVRDGYVYSTVDKLVYSFMYDYCPAGSDLPAVQCQQWMFIDANTGENVIQIGPAPSSSAVLPPNPSASSSGSAPAP